MAKYAQYNPADPSPQPVIGWYDTDVFNYPHLPPASQLMTVTDDQWGLHFSINPNGWTIDGGVLVAPSEAK